MLEIEKMSYWERNTFFDDIDFIIIGAGIVGYSTAIHLKERHPSSKIVLLERGILPTGASSKNAGFTCFGSATELFDDLNNFSEKEVWETVEMRWKGLQYLRTMIGDKNLGLEQNGSWDLITESDQELFKKTEKILPYLNKKIEEITGEKNVYSIDDKVTVKFGLSEIETSFHNRLEGQINTGMMNNSFYKKAVQLGVLPLFGTEVLNIETNSNFQISLSTNTGTISAKKCFICTNGLSQSLSIIKNEDIKPARAQVMITKPIKDLKINGTFHYNQGYYYFRNIDNRILIGGGRNLDFEGETTTNFENTEKITNRLIQLLKNNILPNTTFEIDYSWAGIMGVGKSKKPIIKELSPNLYCGIRLGGMGVAIGTLVGKKLSEFVENNCKK